MDIRSRHEAIVRSLRRKGTATVDELAQEVNASRRTVLRDIGVLRDQGFVIHSEPGRGGGLQLDPQSVQTTPRLAVTEVFALLLSVAAMRAAGNLPFSGLADAGLAKIEKALPPEKVRDLRQFLDCLYVGKLSPQQDLSDIGTMDAALLPAFETAFLERAMLTFRYRDAKGHLTQREVEPQAMLIVLLGGANALAVETGAGQWEIVQAGAAELIAPGRYRLTRLLRGQRGTEWAMVSMVPTGARLVVLGTTVAALPISEADLGLPWNWRIGPASKPVSDETFVAVAFTPEGAGLRPFSVAHVEQPWRTGRSPGDLTIRWMRRSRSLAADTWGAGDVPLAEDSEAYEVEIRDGSTVKRTLTTTTTSVLYSAAQQTTDWGAPLGPGQSLALRIYQLSALIGRGTARSF
jgi:biotin operon repressor